MVGPFVLAFAFVILGLIFVVTLPGAGWILAPILLVVAILIVVRAFTGGRETTRTTPSA